MYLSLWSASHYNGLHTHTLEKTCDSKQAPNAACDFSARKACIAGSSRRADASRRCAAAVSQARLVTQKTRVAFKFRNPYGIVWYSIVW